MKHLHSLPSPSFTFLDKSPLTSPRSDDGDSIHKRMRTMTMPDAPVAHAQSTSALPMSSPASSTSTFHHHPSAGFSSTSIPMSTSPITPRYGSHHPYTHLTPTAVPNIPGSLAKSPRQQTQSLRPGGQASSQHHQSNNFTFPARPVQPTLSRSSPTKTKGTLPPIWDAEDVKSPKRSSFRPSAPAAEGGWNGGLGFGQMHGSPRSSTQASLA